MAFNNTSAVDICSCVYLITYQALHSPTFRPHALLSKIINTLKIDANELFWGTDTHTSESQQLDNQIALYAKQLSIDKKHIVLNLMDDLKNLN